MVARDETPLFTDIANYLLAKAFPKWLTHQQRKKFFTDLKHYILEDPYLFMVWSDQIVRRCILVEEGHDILMHCNLGPIGGHYCGNRMAKKVFDAGFFWPTILKDAQTLVHHCDRCQKASNISKWEEMR